MNKKNKKLLYWGGGLVAILAALAVLAKPSAGPQTKILSGNANAALAAETAEHDFGAISMANGLVSSIYKARNTSSEPIKIGKVYTSCMCTEAIVTVGGQEYGPFGMQGHGLSPRLNKTIEPGEEIEIEAIFDPAAHGPAGVGRAERAVLIETDAGAPLALTFTANVTP